MGSGHGSNFCSNCGSPVNPSDDFCSNCGSAVGDGSGTNEAFRRRIEDLTMKGWEVKHDYGDRVVLIDRGFGSWGVHAILAVFTGGLGNVAYAWYNYSPGADRIELRSDGTEQYLSGSPADRDAGRPGRGNVKRVAVSVVFGLIGISILNGGVGSLTSAFLAVTFLVAALFTFPPTRRRLRDREPVTTFGRVRSTDEEVVDAPDVPCTVCTHPVETGVRRTFRERTCVAGVPVVTVEKGENHYCQSCANGDPFAGTDDEDREKLRDR